MTRADQLSSGMAIPLLATAGASADSQSGIHLMCTDEVEANLVRLNEESRLPRAEAPGEPQLWW
jgi:hypothetical protein